MLPGVAIHAIQSGNNRSTCFFDNEDRALYLFHLGRLLPRAYCRLHAYCLMSNHVHLLLANAKGESCGLLSAHEEYIRLGRSSGERQAVYRDLFGSLQGHDRLQEIRPPPTVATRSEAPRSSERWPASLDVAQSREMRGDRPGTDRPTSRTCSRRNKRGLSLN